MKKLAILVAALALLIVVVPALAAKPVDSPNNGKSHNKATGGVTWTARTHLPPAEQLPGLVSTFSVHEGWGDKEGWGTYSIDRPADESFDGGSLTMDVTCVNVEADETWFAGTVSSATGDYSDTEGNVYLYWVNDVGTPGSAGDLIGGRGYGNISQACDVVEAKGWAGTGVVTGGNLVVHYTTE